MNGSSLSLLLFLARYVIMTSIGTFYEKVVQITVGINHQLVHRVTHSYGEKVQRAVYVVGENRYCFISIDFRTRGLYL